MKNLKDNSNKNYDFSFSYLFNHVSPEELDTLLNRAERKEYTINTPRDIEGKEIPQPEHREKLVVDDEENKVKMYAIDSLGDMIKFGEGSEWCISGRHGANGEVKVSQAREHFESTIKYTKDGNFYVIVTPTTKYCMHIDYWNEDTSLYIRDLNDEEVIEAELLDISPKVAAYFGIEDWRNKTFIYTEDTKTVPKNVVNIKVADGVDTIPERTFSGKYDLKSITMPDSVREIGNEIFSSCIKLSSVRLSNNIKTIPTDAFFQCRNLSELTLPSNLKTINHEAFLGCTSLRELIIPESVTKIEMSAFRYCKCNIYLPVRTGPEILNYGKRGGMIVGFNGTIYSSITGEEIWSSNYSVSNVQ